MAYWFLGGVGLLGAALLLGRWFVRANPALLAQRIRKFAGYALGGLAVMALVRGQVMPAMLLAAGAATLLGWRSLGAPAGGGAGPNPGTTSEVDTAWLAMTLDHASGGLDGTVKQGRFAGKRLGELSREQVIELHQECRGQDAQSATLIETYLDRVHGADWRGDGQQRQQQQEAPKPPPRGNRMSSDEALRVLGLKPGAGPDEIREAHHRLMLKVHPDQGGSDYLAAKLNEAKDVLLGR